MKKFSRIEVLSDSLLHPHIQWNEAYTCVLFLEIAFMLSMIFSLNAIWASHNLSHCMEHNGIKHGVSIFKLVANFLRIQKFICISNFLQKNHLHVVHSTVFHSLAVLSRTIVNVMSWIQYVIKLGAFLYEQIFRKNSEHSTNFRFLRIFCNNISICE